MRQHLFTLVRRSVLATAASFALAACHGSDKSNVTAVASAPILHASAVSTGQSGAVGQALFAPLTVLVTDAAGSPLPGVTIAFTVSAGGGSLSQATAVSNALGQASVVYTLGTTVGLDSVTATAEGAAAVGFGERAVAGPPAQLIVVGQDSVDVAAGTPANIVVKVEDAFGNPVSGATLSWTNDAGADVGAPTNVTGADGTLTLTVMDPVPATIDVLVSLTDLPGISQSVTIVEQ